MLHFREEVSLFSQNQISRILCTTYCCTKCLQILHDVFRVFPWHLFCMQGKLVFPLENKEQVVRFRVYEKTATSAQTNRCVVIHQCIVVIHQCMLYTSVSISLFLSLFLCLSSSFLSPPSLSLSTCLYFLTKKNKKVKKDP